MYFDVYSELGDEYRDYQLIQPEQLNFRQASNDSERKAAASLTRGISKESIILLAVGAGLIVLGVLAVAGRQFGGIILALFGIAPLVIGFVKMKKSKTSSLVAAGILVKKESKSAGTINNRSRRTFRWLVIAVDGMENTLCIVHADPADFDEVCEGDRILVINDKTTFRAKKLT